MNMNMMLEYNIGIDIIKVKRVKKKYEHIIKFFSREEIAWCEQSPRKYETAAGIWASKEAIYKSLSEWDFKIFPQRIKNIEIKYALTGQPKGYLKTEDGQCIEFAVSITHNKKYAIAVAFHIEGDYEGD